MPDLVEYRPARVAGRPAAPAPGRRPPPAHPSPSWPARASAWIRSALGAIDPRGGGDPAFERLAEVAASAREADEVRLALVRLAAEVSGADRVELLRDRGGQGARRLACWPPAHLPAEPSAEPGRPHRGPIGLAPARPRPESLTLSQALKAGEIHFGTLRLTSSTLRAWPAGCARRVATLCAVAASAERALVTPIRVHPEQWIDPELGPQGSTIMNAFLAFAHAQARRRREPLSLLEVAVDRLPALRELLGDELAEAAVERVARAIKATVRASDVMARLEDGRIAVLLPNASAENALRVAEAIRAAVARAGLASTTMPRLTASIGVATYPDHAPDLVTLRAAAATALTRAGGLGHDRIGEADPVDPAGLGQLAG